MQAPAWTALATASFALLHSLLASDGVKNAVADKVKIDRHRYRVLFNAQALLTFGGLVWFIGRQPRRTLYRVRGPLAAVMRLGQLGGVAFAVAAARSTGVLQLAGLGAGPPPAAQGPEADADGVLRAQGPFRLVRHPLNVAPLAPFWLTPHMTSRRLVFNVVATAYLVMGSVHEERRLLHQYGEAYERYRRSGVPFYLPRLSSRRPSRVDRGEMCARAGGSRKRE